jgi:hypothetical protein
MKLVKENVTFDGMTGNLYLSVYRDGNPSLILASMFEVITTCSVNIPEQLVMMQPDEILIKDYSENEGMLDLLIKEGVVTDTGHRVQSGFVEIPICKLTEMVTKLM